MRGMRTAAAGALALAVTASPVSAAERGAITLKNNADGTACTYTMKLASLDSTHTYAFKYGKVSTIGNMSEYGSGTWSGYTALTYQTHNVTSSTKSSYPRIYLHVEDQSNGNAIVIDKFVNNGCTVG